MCYHIHYVYDIGALAGGGPRRAASSRAPPPRGRGHAEGPIIIIRSIIISICYDMLLY